jgi:sugar phosphate isomerase/epimerase
MQTISRRGFLGCSAAEIAVAGYLSRPPLALGAELLGMPIGCQVFTVRKQLAEDFAGTLKELTGIGYSVIEFCSPPSYVSSGFGPLVHMKAREIRQKVADAGLRMVSCHYQFAELKKDLDERIAFAKELGLEHMVVATLAIGPNKPLDDWRRAADEMNKLGERTQKAGIQLGFHNHNSEFREVGDTLIFDELMKRFDPKLVKSQFQVSVVSDGFDPVAYLAKYPGRFLSLHLQDWSAATKTLVAIGQGSIDWKKLFPAAKKGGVKYCFVEMNMDLLKASFPYLRSLKV